jgi:glucose-6-phosphate isomerase
MLTLDINSSTRGSTEAGIDIDRIRGSAPRVEKALADLGAGGDFTGWVSLPLDEAPAVEARTWASELPASIHHAVVMGIGGSSLGPLTIYEAVHHPGTLLGTPLAGQARRLWFLDNSDPDTVRGVLDALDPAETLYIVITKSGSTAETATQLMIAWDRASTQLGDEARNHFVFVTDPERGDLRALAGRLDVRCFDVPPDVGGRFSVLSAVGLVPCAVAGIDPVELLAGARAIHRSCLTAPIESNPAALFAVTAHLMDVDQKRPIHVMMPYSDRLGRVGEWFRQLWAESLGKRDATGRGIGPTPINARGATDQHSLLQLLAEGPADKFVIFLDVTKRAEMAVPALFGDLGSFGYLAGHTLAELIGAELKGTEASLARAGTPSVTITLDEITPGSVAALLYMFEVATAVAGSLYGIDPYHQPGVEASKKLTCGLLGRKGFEQAGEQAREYDANRNSDLIVKI